MDDRKFQDTVEKHPSTAGVTTIEPEDELVEVAWQVGRIHGALVGTKYPAFGQGGDPVHRHDRFETSPISGADLNDDTSAHPSDSHAHSLPGIPFRTLPLGSIHSHVRRFK